MCVESAVKLKSTNQLFMSGSNMRATNPRWLTTAILITEKLPVNVLKW